jgi:hypothetical protein
MSCQSIEKYITPEFNKYCISSKNRNVSYYNYFIGFLVSKSSIDKKYPDVKSNQKYSQGIKVIECIPKSEDDIKMGFKGNICEISSFIVRDKFNDHQEKMIFNYKMYFDQYYIIDFNGSIMIFEKIRIGNSPVGDPPKCFYEINCYTDCSNEKIKEFNELSHTYYKNKIREKESIENTITVYNYDEHGYWDENKLILKRKLDTIYLPNKVKDNIYNDIKIFLSDKNKRVYDKLGIPWKRNYLFEGNWGGGKTSLIRALASEFNLGISIINFTTGITDTSLNNALKSISDKTICVIEDIDSIFEERKKNDELKNGITFSGLLNCLDGFSFKSGLITIITTNYKNRLDSALIRPGRIDYILNFGYVKKEQMFMMYIKFMYVNEEIYHEDWVKYLTDSSTKPEDFDMDKVLTSNETKTANFNRFYKQFKSLSIQITTSLLQQYLIKYMGDVEKSIENIEEIRDIKNSVESEKKDLYS